MTTLPDSLTTKITSEYSWVIHHLLSLAIAGALVLGGVYLVESLVARHDAATAVKYQSILTEQELQTKTLVAQFQESESQRDELESKLLEQNDKLTQTIETRNQQVASLVKIDATLSAQQAARKITVQMAAEPHEVVASGDNVTLDLPVARGIASRLDRLPIVQENLADTQKKLDNQVKVSASLKSSEDDERNIISSQKIQLMDSGKACKTQIAALKAENRKSKIKSFFAGAAVVIIGVVMHAAGI